MGLSGPGKTMRPSSVANQFELETLEPRILLSAEPVLLAAAGSPSSAVVAVAAASQHPLVAEHDLAVGSSSWGSPSDSLFEGFDGESTSLETADKSPAAPGSGLEQRDVEKATKAASASEASPVTAASQLSAHGGDTQNRPSLQSP